MSDLRPEEKEVCGTCHGKGVVRVCCERPVHDPHTLSGFICCENWDLEACDVCDAYQTVAADE